MAQDITAFQDLSILWMRLAIAQPLGKMQRIRRPAQ
jgi:hypothetical protein